MATQSTALTPTSKAGIFVTFGNRFDLDPEKVRSVVASTVFKGSKEEAPLTPEETAAALIVCNQYDLNPFTKEIYAFRSKGKLLIVVGVDGWSTIVNRQSAFNGVEFEEHFDEKGNIRAVTCKIHRKDRAVPTVVTEYTHECKRNTEPWNNMPIRMTRNRSFVQCARIAFSISGIVDEDEAQTIEGAPEFRYAAAIAEGGTRTEQVRNVIKARNAKATQPVQASLPEAKEQVPAQVEKPEPEPQTVEAQPQAEPDDNSPWGGTFEQSGDKW